MWRTNRRIVQLPSVQDLRALVEIPLADSEKVPITKWMYESLLSTLPSNECSSHDLDTLFTIGELYPSLVTVVSAVTSPPPPSGTADSFHCFWDNNIRNIIEILIPSGESIRNCNHHTATNKLRPDFGFLLNTICLFRGEEKEPGNMEDPRAELVEKLVWIYDPAPYMLGECSCSAILSSEFLS